jgi:hypothetical protein
MERTGPGLDTSLGRRETMTARVCPYLRAVDDPGVYTSAPDATNGCYAVSSDGPAYIPLDFQGSTCLAGQPGLCSRYQAAARSQTHRPARRLLVVGGGLVTLVVLAGCAVLAVLALILGGLGASRLGLLARVTDTPQPTLTPSLTWTPTASPTPTEQPTDTATATSLPLPPTATATATPRQFLPTATVSPMNSPGGAFISPLVPPTLPPTAMQLWPTATRLPWPTATQRPFPTLTRGPTLTPSATYTRLPTATPLAICRIDDTMTFDPANPTPGETFIIEVRSLTSYTDVSLTGAGSPRFIRAKHTGGYYLWTWKDSFDTAGTYSYSFNIRNEAATCVTKSVAVAAPTDTPAPTNTPTPTPTVTPVYNVGLALIGNDFRSIYTDTQPVIFELELNNGGNVPDTFQVWLDVDPRPPKALTAQYCIGDSCSDYTVPDMQVTLPQGRTQALYIKLIAASNAQGGYTLSATLWVQSHGDPTKKQSKAVKVVVTKPSSSP